MRIGFDAKRIFHNNTGLGNYSRNLVDALHTIYPENEYLLYDVNGKPNNKYVPKESMEIRTPEGLWKQVSSIWRQSGVKSQLKRDQLDLFHGLSHIVPKNINRTGIPSVVSIHDLIFMRYPELYARVDCKMYERHFRRSCNDADRIIAMSCSTRSDIVHFFQIPEEKIDVVYQSCDPIFFETSSSEDRERVRTKYNLPKEYILNVGTIEERKNLLTLLKAMVEHQIQMPLVVVGRPTKYMDHVKKYITQHKIEKQVIFLHSVLTSELPSIYQQCKLFVYPSYFEGFGIPIVEAIASKVPVVTSAGSCFSEPGGGAALYANPSDPEDVGRLMAYVLNSEEISSALVTRGQKHVQKFTSESFARNTFDVYAKVLR